MAFEDVYLVSEKLILTPGAELDELQKWMAAPLPRGYREYMTTLGVGTYCDLVQVLTPAQVREARDERREFVREYYLQFWGENETSLALEEAVGGVFFASTCDGDEVYYLPDKGRLFVLPRHDDVVYWLEVGFADPLDWTSPSRRPKVYQPPFRYFEPRGGDRRIIEFFTAGAFDMGALAERFRTRWSGQEVRSIPGPESVLLFPRAIRGRVQLTQAPADPRVGIRVDYDNDCSAEVERFAGELREMGFFETWRHPTPNT
jgi:hypothetical protein